VDEVLQSRPDTAFLGPALRRLHETSGANPLFAIELSRTLLDPDADAVPNQPFPTPSSLSELLAARLARISPPTRRELLAASALARPTVDLVLETTGRDGGRRVSLGQTVDAEVIALHGGEVRFTHPLLSSVSTRRRQSTSAAGWPASLTIQKTRHLGLSVDAPYSDIATTLEHVAQRAASR
jgi:hypothetical protein